MFNVLHVDENFFYKEILKELSVEKEFRYFSTSKPKKTFEILKNNKIDLIITGLEFEDNEKGEEFVNQLKKSEYKDIPIIVLTAVDDQKLKNRLTNIGILDFLLKDDFIDSLIVHINKIRTGDFISYQLQNMQIAVLDDDELQLAMIKDIFSSNNINNVDYYTNPQDLLNNKEKYCIYLIDYILPHISGDKVIEKIRNNNEYSVIIAVSAIDDQNVVSRILSIGADDYITKPYLENVFIAQLKANVRTYNLLEKLKEKNEKLEQAVKIDGLTGLLNHKHIIEQLEQEISRANRYNSSLSIIMIDIDGFKLINDRHGHQIGDEVLIELSNFLKNDLREIDSIGRYGGEEFLIIIPESNLNKACLIGERVRKGIERLLFSEDKLKLTISAGIAELKSENPYELIKKADLLLYKAKNNGKNRVEYCLED